MQRQLKIRDKLIPYNLRLSRRAKSMCLAVYSDSRVVLTLPIGLDFAEAEKFVKEKFAWIIRSLERFKPYQHRAHIKSGRREYFKHRQQALTLAQDRVGQWNNTYNFPINRVNIKNQKTRWGSCGKKGNLNFNYKIVHLPEKLVDYLIVHELCHLKEFNHSKNFWNLVTQTMPEYKKLRTELRLSSIKAA